MITTAFATTGSSQPVYTQTTAGNGITFNGGFQGLLETGSDFAHGIADVVNAFKKPPKTTVVMSPPPPPAPAPAPQSGMSPNTMMILAAVGVVVLVVAMK